MTSDLYMYIFQARFHAVVAIRHVWNDIGCNFFKKQSSEYIPKTDE